MLQNLNHFSDIKPIVSAYDQLSEARFNEREKTEKSSSPSSYRGVARSNPVVIDQPRIVRARTNNRKEIDQSTLFNACVLRPFNNHDT